MKFQWRCDYGKENYNNQRKRQSGHPKQGCMDVRNGTGGAVRGDCPDTPCRHQSDIQKLRYLPDDYPALRCGYSRKLGYMLQYRSDYRPFFSARYIRGEKNSAESLGECLPTRKKAFQSFCTFG